MRSLSLLLPALLLGACATPSAPAVCGDAVYWSQRAASWPTDALFLGDTPLDQANAVDLLELPPESAADRLAAALVVAELNLAAGDHDAPTSVYAAHAWFADHAGSPGADHEADALTRALHAEALCL